MLIHSFEQRAEAFALRQLRPSWAQPLRRRQHDAVAAPSHPDGDSENPSCRSA